MTQTQSVKIYVGVPQTAKLPVYEAKQGNRVTATKMILTNTDTVASKVTITLNTIDIMKDILVAGGETKFLDIAVVMDPNDTLSIQQEKQNAVNVTITGVLESTFAIPGSY
ncbi:hypothetical protein CUC43_00370 [Bacillus thuringiensis LM1212]|uniref:hypothetical protein n=1 Tax=Bacillus cereus group TaxID=86661 RepID=UPI000420BE8E|nr:MULTISPECIES: hypothetical protein [Bacillus cereus group]AXY05487.1 hypothetical protein CUC43_00370 [Bacillus thuringiensis LM1212]QDF23906.1 hypothetical protein FJR70_13080 [Bacillus tropicus]QUG97223.1 hypothetical protein HCM98_20700 [Bacillus tropicus]